MESAEKAHNPTSTAKGKNIYHALNNPLHLDIVGSYSITITLHHASPCHLLRCQPHIVPCHADDISPSLPSHGRPIQHAFASIPATILASPVRHAPSLLIIAAIIPFLRGLPSIHVAIGWTISVHLPIRLVPTAIVVIISSPRRAP